MGLMECMWKQAKDFNKIMHIHARVYVYRYTMYMEQ